MNKRFITTALFALVTCVSSIAQGQLFHPLGLEAKCDRGKNDFSQPRMHVEGNVLYVCTLQGLYSKDLSAENSSWQLVGFEGIPLQDYVRRGGRHAGLAV